MSKTTTAGCMMLLGAVLIVPLQTSVMAAERAKQAQKLSGLQQRQIAQYKAVMKASRENDLDSRAVFTKLNGSIAKFCERDEDEYAALAAKVAQKAEELVAGDKDSKKAKKYVTIAKLYHFLEVQHGNIVEAVRQIDSFKINAAFSNICKAEKKLFLLTGKKTSRTWLMPDEIEDIMARQEERKRRQRRG